MGSNWSACEAAEESLRPAHFPGPAIQRYADAAPRPAELCRFGRTAGEKHSYRVVALNTAGLSSNPSEPAAIEPGDRISSWEGFQRRDFLVEGRKALLIVPVEAAPTKPWIWRTEFFGHQPQADKALLARGFHVAYVDVQNLYGAPVALDHMDRFYDHLTSVRGLSSQTVLEGFSRGGTVCTQLGGPSSGTSRLHLQRCPRV